MALGVALAVAGLALRLGGPQVGPARRATLHPSAQLVATGRRPRPGGSETTVDRAALPLSPAVRLVVELRAATA